MDLSSYRRKIKYISPITLMREFYYDSMRKTAKRFSEPLIHPSCAAVTHNKYHLEKFNKILLTNTSRSVSSCEIDEKNKFSKTNYTSSEKNIHKCFSMRSKENQRENFSKCIQVFRPLYKTNIDSQKS